MAGSDQKEKGATTSPPAPAPAPAPAETTRKVGFKKNGLSTSLGVITPDSATPSTK